MESVLNRVKPDREIIGRPGGIARAKKLSKTRRAEIAKKAANTRWAGHAKRMIKK